MIKTFEKYTSDLKYKKGDYVKKINEPNEIYTIISIDDIREPYMIQNINILHDFCWIDEWNIIKLSEEETAALKYNL